MNLNRKQIIAKVAEIKKQEKELGVKINLNADSIYSGRQDAIWYGGTIGTIEYGDYSIDIEAVGEIVADLYINGEFIDRVSTDWNNGVFFEKFSEYIANDVELNEITLYEYVDEDVSRERGSKPVLFVNNNNWLEFCIIDPDGYRQDVGFMGEIIEENDVLEAFENIQFYLDIIEEYK